MTYPIQEQLLLTNARMPAFIASGSSGHAVTRAARSGSSPVATTAQPRVAAWVAVEARRGSEPLGMVRVAWFPRACRKSRGLAGFCVFFQSCSAMTGEGLEPSTNGLTYLIGFHRPPCPRVRPHGEFACKVLMVWTISSPSQACRV
jgi:hypothetical protein